jgi:selenocysteine-specific elongation factor
MIVTLAGHVDHGKTSLVQALTGVNTDRLDEEKRRGLTIDLGFAYLNEGDTTLGFVDVPGHHRFIHNMVAGVSSDQFALLVVAADDGPMPQSREHLQILDLLGIERGVVALTKCDRVSEDRKLAARAEIEKLIQDTCLSQAEIFETSTETGEGIDSLKAHLLSQTDRPDTNREGAAFRLPIDRAFTISGAGVVVTGTVHSGSVEADDSLTLFPSMTQVRVKSIRAQDQPVDQAVTGNRSAINLSGVDISQVARGQWLTSGDEAPTREFTLDLAVLDDFPRAIRHWLPVHVYHATSHTTGHIALLSEQRIAPGTRALVELVTSEPLLLRRGDRLIIRDQGLDRTLGGGAVVSTSPAVGRRRADNRLRRLSADRAADPAESLRAHLAIGAVDLDSFRRNWGLTEGALTSLLAESECEQVDGHAIEKTMWEQWRARALKEIGERHAADAALQGLKQSELDLGEAASFAETLLRQLVSDGSLSAQAGRYSPIEHKVALSDAEQKLFDRVERLLNQPQPPSLGDMAKQFRIGVGDLAKQLHPLVAKKYLVRISDTRYYLPEQLRTLAELARRLNDEAPFTVRQYRDAAEIGRNVAIEVLEHFDRIGLTRRDADVRRLIGNLEELLS